uniref:Uncharacterized protein n=1 Tax=Quercus lobata TaxID=97700 RepID=A0A7N2M2J1_QUELO
MRYWARYVRKGEVKSGEVVLAIQHLLGCCILGETSQRRGDLPSIADIEVLERQCGAIPLRFCHVEYGRKGDAGHSVSMNHRAKKKVMRRQRAEMGYVPNPSDA